MKYLILGLCFFMVNALADDDYSRDSCYVTITLPVNQTSIISVGDKIRSSKNNHAIFDIQADPYNQYYDNDTDAYRIPSGVKTINVPVRADDFSAHNIQIPPGLIDEPYVIDDGYMFSVINPKDLTGC